MATTYELPSFRTFEARSGPLPRAYADAIWGFHLRPAPGGRTRLGLTWANALRRVQHPGCS